jgi:asparagine synthase (glutamine-hydrolysing)
MCGIFCAISFNGFFHKDDYKRFVELTNMVNYRGPDASGYKAFNIKEPSLHNENKFNIFLGHRRLSIIDLSEAGTQPFTDDNGLWIIFNGEIFNYIELREELKKKGHRFKSETDFEVVLKIYSEDGEAGFDRLNGMWAFAIVDIPKSRMVLSRDRFSIKPLYYINVDNQFYFASEIKQLLQIAKKKEINTSVMFKYLEQGLVDYNEETFYRQIYKLKPKFNLVIHLDSGKIEQKKYWDYSPENETSILSLDETEEKFRELLIDSIRIRLRSDVKVGALLSGGLDSSSISVISDNIQRGKFQTYSIVSKHRKYSEEKYIDILSKFRGIHNSKIFFEFESYDSFLKDMEKIIYHNDEPFGGFSVIAQYKVLEMLKRNSDITVVLSGQGGDEVLMGYLKYFFFNIKNLVKGGSFLKALNQIVLSLIKGTIIRQFKLSEARRYIPFLLKKAPKKFLLIKDKLEPVWHADDLRERQILDIDKYSIPALTRYEDRNSMAHSLETRLPFLDHRLVNYVLNLPISLKLNGGWTKYVLRRSIYELPDAIRWRRDKQGFIIPEELWLKKNFSPLINEIFNNSILDKMNIISGKSFLEYYRRFQSGKAPIWYMDISRTLIAELWARKLFDWK